MANKFVCILDIGSSKITAIIGEKGLNNTFNIRGNGEVEYSGYMEGQFLNESEIHSVISGAITKAETNCGLKVTKVYVGVPAEFTYCITKEAKLNFGRRKKIAEEDIVELSKVAGKDIVVSGKVVISNSPVHFMLEDNKKCMDPINMISSRLIGNLGFILAESSFIDLIDSILKNLEILEVEYISSVLAEALYLIEPDVRDSGAVLIDCGYITTFVAVVRGDAILYLSAFSVGGGHIAGDLCQVLNLSFSQAESLKRKVVLSLDATDNDFYELNVNGSVTPFSAKLANEIVSARVEMLAGMINKCLLDYKPNNKNYLPVYLTGGGICYLKGGKDLLSKNLGSNIEVVAPPVPQLNRPHFSSSLALLEIALKKEKRATVNIFKLIKNKLLNLGGVKK